MSRHTGNRLWPEIRSLLALGFPIMLTQIAHASIGFVDALVAGQYNTFDLAAVALGSSIWLPIFLTATGILMIATPLVAHATGAREPDQVNRTLFQGLWVAAVLGIVAIWLLNNASLILDLLQVTPDLQVRTQSYLKMLAWGAPALIFYQVIRSYFEGLGKTRPGMYIALAGFAANIPLNYLLVFGKFGLPEMGAAGCGLASAFVMWLELICSIWFMHKDKRLQLPAPVTSAQRFHLPSLLNFLRLGIPLGFALLIEASMFSIISLLLAPLGTQVVAANQITISVTGQIFMIPLSLAMATTIRVGFLSGAGNAQAAWFSAKAALVCTGLIACLTSVSLWLGATPIAALFTQDIQVISLTASLLGIAALFGIPDALQVTAAGALRGYKDTTVPLFMVFIAYWLIGLPTGYTLAMTDWITAPQGAAGFWYGLIIGLSAGAVLLLIRLFHLPARRLVTTGN